VRLICSGARSADGFSWACSRSARHVVGEPTLDDSDIDGSIIGSDSGIVGDGGMKP